MPGRNRNASSHADPKRKWPNHKRGSGPRGNAPEPSLKRYLALAHAAEAEGDVVASQNYYQHAEHYFRQLHSPAE